jgi:hypothetical protein
MELKKPFGSTRYGVKKKKKLEIIQDKDDLARNIKKMKNMSPSQTKFLTQNF